MFWWVMYFGLCLEVVLCWLIPRLCFVLWGFVVLICLDYLYFADCFGVLLAMVVVLVGWLGLWVGWFGCVVRLLLVINLNVLIVIVLHLIVLLFCIFYFLFVWVFSFWDCCCLVDWLAWMIVWWCLNLLFSCYNGVACME